MRRAAELAGRLVTVLEDPKKTDTDRLSTLAGALIELAARMEPKEDGGSLAGRLVTVLEDSKETDADRLSTLGRCWSRWRPRWSPRRRRLGGAWLAVLADSQEEPMLTAC